MPEQPSNALVWHMNGTPRRIHSQSVIGAIKLNPQQKRISRASPCIGAVHKLVLALSWYMRRRRGSKQLHTK